MSYIKSKSLQKSPMRKFAFLKAWRWRALRRIISLHGYAIGLRGWALAQKAGYEIHAQRQEFSN